MTMALTIALSPARRNLGRLGWTITGFEEIISRDSDDVSISEVNARAHRCQVVLALGAVNENSSVPSSPVVSDGSKNASGISAGRYWKSSFTGACAAAPASAIGASASISTASSATSSLTPFRASFLYIMSLAPEAYSLAEVVRTVLSISSR